LKFRVKVRLGVAPVPVRSMVTAVPLELTRWPSLSKVSVPVPTAPCVSAPAPVPSGEVAKKRQVVPAESRLIRLATTLSVTGVPSES